MNTRRTATTHNGWNRAGSILGLFGLLGLWAGGCTGLPGGEEAAAVRLEIREAPNDAACLRITVSGSRTETRRFDLTPGASTVFRLASLPVGRAVFLGEAFAGPCGQVGATSVPSYTSTPVTVTLVPGPNPDVVLVMRRSAGGGVVVEFPGEEETCTPGGGLCTTPGQCCSNRCDFSLGPQEGVGVCGGLDVLDGPLVDLPASLQAQDFRLRPPQVLGVEAQAGVQGGTVVLVRFAKDQRLGRQVTLLPGEEGEIVLADDGRGGDEIAGDGVYSATLPVAFDEVRAGQSQLLADLRKAGVTTIPIFQGRELVGQRQITFSLPGGNRIPILTNPPPVIPIDPARSQVITSVSVVTDPGRTRNPCTGAGNPNGVWTFRHVMEGLANQPVTGINPADLTLNWLQNWLNGAPVNGFPLPVRTAINNIINNWPLVGGKLDLNQSPFRLLAIVNRIDLAGSVSYGPVGGAEGRLVFGLVDPVSCTPQPFEVIFEYLVPRNTCTTLRSWAQAWEQLSTLPLGSASYNAALAALTEQFVAAGASPAKLNGSAIGQVRTNDFELASPWELREFRLQPVPLVPPFTVNLLAPDTVKRTPDASFNGTSALANFINTNQAAVLNGSYMVPAAWVGSRAPIPPNFWSAPGIGSNQARHQFSLNTCNGCHRQETGTNFTHIGWSAPIGSPASLSGFMTGITISDPVVTSTSRTFNDIAQRNVALHAFATASCSRTPITATGMLLPAIQVSPLLNSH